MSMRAVLVFGVVLLAGVGAVGAQDTAAWEKRLQARHEQLVKQNGPGTDAALRTKLLAMRDADQAARFRNVQDVAQKKPTDAHELHALDVRLTGQLKAIVAAKGWPTIHLVGIDASDAPMLILIHSPDHVWQRSLLPQLEDLAKAGKIDGSQLALVIDKELLAMGKPQRFGSQFKFVGGKAMMVAVEDPAGLDKRREAVMLPPLAVYKKKLGEMYHVEVSDVILRPEAKKD
jgi:hypothetical protein